MSALAGALVLIVGAAIVFWAFATPGDQVAIAALGGVMFAIGASVLVDGAS